MRRGCDWGRPGDGGRTLTGDNVKVSKAHARIEALGEVDELNCVLGLLGQELSGPRKALIKSVQNDLFDLGADICAPAGRRRHLTLAHIVRLRSAAARFKERSTRKGGFVLPGGNRKAAWAHFARAVCRRAERRVWALLRGKRRGIEAGTYLNCLGDLLYILARLAVGRGRQEMWIRRASLESPKRSLKIKRLR